MKCWKRVTVEQVAAMTADVRALPWYNLRDAQRAQILEEHGDATFAWLNAYWVSPGHCMFCMQPVSIPDDVKQYRGCPSCRTMTSDEQRQLFDDIEREITAREQILGEMR